MADALNNEEKEEKEEGEEEEEKHVEFDNGQFESGSDSKEEHEFIKVHELDLERQGYYVSWNWKPCKVRIFPDSASIFIDNDNYFMEYANTNILPLNKCTISVTTNINDDGDKIILYLELLYKDKDITLKTVFRMPQNKMDKDAFKFTLFAATLRFYGSQFEELKAALKDWDKQRSFSKKRLTKSQIIAIFKKKYEYDLFEGRHEMNKYVEMIENMEAKVIKPLQAVLKLTEFSTKEPEQWRVRCTKALEIEYEWKILSSQMTVQLSKIHRISKYKKTQIDEETVAHYEEIQLILSKLSAQIKAFYDDMIVEEIKAWRELVQKYQISANKSNSGHQWKIITGIAIALVAAGIIIGFVVCPPAAAVTATATGAAVTATTSTATVGITSTAVTAVTAAAVGGLGGLGLLGWGLREYYNLPSEYKIYQNVEYVTNLWKEFKNTYLYICQDIKRIETTHIGTEPGSMWREDTSDLIKENIMEMGELSVESIKRIKKIC